MSNGINIKLLPQLKTRLVGTTSRGIKGVYINDERHLIFILTDNTELDLGYIGMAENPVSGGGITDTARALLISILRNAVFSADQSTAITALNTELAKTLSGDNGSNSGEEERPDTVTYMVVNTLENVETNNNTTTVTEGSAYTAILSGVGDYSIESVTVTMGGVDITDTVYSSLTGTITIAQVTGDIIITASGKIVKIETLSFVSTTSYPDTTNYAYTEGNDRGAGVGYFVARCDTIQGGLLEVDYNVEECNIFDLNLFVFDAEGNPYKHTSNTTSWNGELVNPTWNEPGSGAGFGLVSSPFSVQIPEECTFLVNFRRKDGMTGTAVSNNETFVAWVKNGGITFTVTG